MRSGLNDPLKFQHEEIKKTVLYVSVNSGDRLSKAISSIVRALADHYDKEEVSILPMLGVLQPLSKEKIDTRIENSMNYTKIL